MNRVYCFLFFIVAVLYCNNGLAQVKDSTIKDTASIQIDSIQKNDSLPKEKKNILSKTAEIPKKIGLFIKNTFAKDTIHDPYTYGAKVAAKRSALLPGWGQMYNKKYWKLPIVYGALGVCAGIFIDNIAWYKRTKFAYSVLYKRDTANYKNVYHRLRPTVESGNLEALSYYRKDFRRNVDYSVLIFAGLWGLNVIDAAVDGHLKTFDVSPDLSFKIKPGYSPMANTAGVSIIFDIGKNINKKYR